MWSVGSWHWLAVNSSGKRTLRTANSDDNFAQHTHLSEVIQVSVQLAWKAKPFGIEVVRVRAPVFHHTILGRAHHGVVDMVELRKKMGIKATKVCPISLRTRAVNIDKSGCPVLDALWRCQKKSQNEPMVVVFVMIFFISNKPQKLTITIPHRLLVCEIWLPPKVLPQRV